jgi:hypothetical protein
MLLLTKYFITMKNISSFCLLLICIAFESCQKNQEAKPTTEEKPISVECYKALYENDTINLKINTLKDGAITGNMVMKINDSPEKTGTISGNFHGDTLFVDYSFIQGTNEERTFKNPMALLKKKDSLILGNGKIESHLGRSYFSKETPIDFDRVKYKFSKVECKNK